MVRLKGTDFLGGSACPAKFQFQNGAIKSRQDLFGRRKTKMFQFQNGAIKSKLSSSDKIVETVSIPKWCD